MNQKFQVQCSWPSWFGSLDLNDIKRTIELSNSDSRSVAQNFVWWQEYAGKLVSKGIAPRDIIVALHEGDYKKVKYFTAVFASSLQKNQNILFANDLS